MCVHGAVAQPRRCNHGLVAAFANELLKAFIGPIQQECPGGKPRYYVDGITLQVHCDTAQLCAERMHAQLEQLNAALRRDHIVSYEGKQQVLGLTKEVRDAWRPHQGCRGSGGQPLSVQRQNAQCWANSWQTCRLRASASRLHAARSGCEER